MATVANYWLQPRPAFARVHRLLCVVCHALQVVPQLWLPIGAKALPGCIDCFVTDALLHDCSSLATWSILPQYPTVPVEVSYW